MNKTYLLALLLPFAVYGQSELPDTIKTQDLDEVVVQAQLQRTGPTETVYTPTGKQKNAAQNAIDLLRVMALPQLRINPIDNKVTDNFGGDVVIYINYLEASKEEMDGLRTYDVRKIEFLEFPTDPRFRGAQKVVNIIVQEYAYGGYTKLSADENFMTGLSSRTNAFSKFTYRRMTYDLFVGANNWNNKHIGNTIEATYSLMDNNGAPTKENRNEMLESSKFKQNQYPVTFRATYNSDKVQIRNMVGFQHQSNPNNSERGKLTYSSMKNKDYTFDRMNTIRTNSASYSGTYFFVLPKSYSIDISPSFNYTHTNDDMSYSTTLSQPILRIANEDAYNYRINAYVRKNIGQKHSLMIGGNGGEWRNKLKYTGSATYDDKFSNAFAAGMVGYNFQTQKIAVNFDVGYAWERSDINGLVKDDSYPFTHVNVRYSLNNKNMFSLYFQYASNTPGISEKAADVLQDNELMYITGNPYLKNARHTTVNMAYTWLPSNALGVSAYGNFFGMYDRQVCTYSQYDNGQALIREWINNGDYLSGKIGLAANWKLIGGKLQFYVNPEQQFYKTTGIFHRTYYPFVCSAQASYYLGSFYFQAYYQSPEKQLFSNFNTKYRSRNFHSLTVGWANAEWNIKIMAANIFNKGWKGSTQELETALYHEIKTSVGTYYHPRINLSVTYTFGYGKKVQRGNEVGEQSGAASAIMK